MLDLTKRNYNYCVNQRYPRNKNKRPTKHKNVPKVSPIKYPIITFNSSPEMIFPAKINDCPNEFNTELTNPTKSSCFQVSSLMLARPVPIFMPLALNKSVATTATIDTRLHDISLSAVNSRYGVSIAITA